MEKRKKQQILNQCHSNTIPIESLDKMVKDGDISIEELQEHNLEIAKVNELKKRKTIRENGEFVDEGIVENTKKGGFIYEDHKVVEDDSPKNHFDQPISHKDINSVKSDAIKKVLEANAVIEEIKQCIIKRTYSFQDLEAAGLPEKLLNSLIYHMSGHRITLFKNIEDLPPMQEGRTDLYFVGVSAAGKSTMLAGILYEMHKQGNLSPDTYNPEGTEYQSGLMQDLDQGILPQRTQKGSYNYLAVSLKDNEKKDHPFNIIEIPGEDYESITKTGLKHKSFLKYINNSNKKILIFVIDVNAHEKRRHKDLHSALNQSVAYSTILNMFRDDKILQDTDAIYLVLNKFDLVRDSHRLNEEPEENTATRYLNEEFKSLINNCIDARDRVRNKIRIKILPFSIGNVKYGEILETFNQHYSQVLADNLLNDSFIVRGGKFWKKIF